MSERVGQHYSRLVSVFIAIHSTIYGTASFARGAMTYDILARLFSGKEFR